jgi:thiamine biosynthesis lipoprotein
VTTQVADEVMRRAEPVMGTVVSLHVRPGRAPSEVVYLALAEARDRLHRADAVFSTWKSESPLSRYRRGEIELHEGPAEMAEVLQRCEKAKDLSGGWFDPWSAPGGVDPTGLVKGWAAARALAALRDAGVAAAVVNAGGDVGVFGRPGATRPWRIGIQNPFDRSTLVAVVEPQSAVATSGCYERGLHVYDPFRREASAAVASATVTGPELDLADALATGLVAGGATALGFVETIAGYEALLIGHDGAQVTTSGFALA